MRRRIEDQKIVSGQLRYPIYFRPLFEPKCPAPEAVKVKMKVKGPLFCERLTRYRPPDCVGFQMNWNQPPSAEFAFLLEIYSVIVADRGKWIIALRNINGNFHFPLFNVEIWSFCGFQGLSPIDQSPNSGTIFYTHVHFFQR